MAKPCRAFLSTRPMPPVASRWSARNSSPVWASKPLGTSGSTAAARSACEGEPRR